MNALIPANIQVPAHLAARVGVPSALSKSLGGGLSAGANYPRISIKASRFRIVEGDTETVLNTTELDVIIVGANPRISKAWYSKAWNKDAEPSAPDCFSHDGVSPHPESTDPQNDLCASCPHNAWGSKVTDAGQQIKACADKKRLAIVSADDPSGSVYLLEVTPAALKGLNQYQKELAMRGIPAEIVKTKVSFDTDASFPKLTFGFGGFLDADTQEVVDKLFGSDAVKEITGEAEVATPVPVAKPAKALVAPKPEPKPEPVVEAAPPKRGFGAAKPAAPKPAAPKPEPEAIAASSLADEIAALVEEVGADDA